jgi:hypothetical protein
MKMIRDELVETITKYGDYVEEQGGERSYIDNLSEPIQVLIDTIKLHFTKMYLTCGCAETLQRSSAEQIIDRGLVDGMSRKKYYKDIYKDIKRKVELFAELHGRSEVISKQLSE